MTAEGHYPPRGLEAVAREKWVGNEVAEMLMTAYMSAEQERTLAWKPEGLGTFVPEVACGEWVP